MLYLPSNQQSITFNYFASSGSCVFAAALDLSKAFDGVNHWSNFPAHY